MTKKYFKYLLKDVMDLCQSEGLHQVDLLSPAAVRITEEEYRAQKRGQENLDKLNAEIRAAQMIPRYTTFQTQKQFLRDAITETANSSSSLEEFRQLLKENMVSKSRNSAVYSATCIRTGTSISADVPLEQTTKKSIFRK